MILFSLANRDLENNDLFLGQLLSLLPEEKRFLEPLL